MTRQKTPDGENGPSRMHGGRVEGHKGLSSSTYVVGELDMSRRGEDGKWIQEIRRSAIPIRTAPRCDHSETVCAKCAETWMFDWVFRFDRTAGGRRLRDELGGEKALAAMAERRVRADGAVAAGRQPDPPAATGTARMAGTVVGVPVDVEVADGELVITVGRFGPAAAGRLGIDSHSGTATLVVAVAGEDDDAMRPGQRPRLDLYPDTVDMGCPPGQEAQ
jgi:hypothetical protein